MVMLAMKDNLYFNAISKGDRTLVITFFGNILRSNLIQHLFIDIPIWIWLILSPPSSAAKFFSSYFINVVLLNK
jgi:hypothetical protein